MSDRPHIFDLEKAQLTELVQSHGMPRFRATQVLKWVYQRGVVAPGQMTDLSRADRERLGELVRFNRLHAIGHQLATDGTEKLLLGLTEEPPADEAEAERVAGQVAGSTECVMIPSGKGSGPGGGSGAARRTACISSQVGCPVGCRFCASGLGGLERNLSAGRIVEQVWHLNQLPAVREAGGITNLVFMGMGEPLTNFAEVSRALRILTAKWGFDLSARKITLSTVGLPAQMRRLAELDLPITLALSLHAPNDELRRELIPWAENTSIEALVEAGRHYFERTGRELTLEYILLGGVNDRPEHAKQLAGITRRLRCNVNLIRYNEVKGLPYQRPGTEDVRRFRQELEQRRVNVHIRASRGRDIAAACGQLRHERRQREGKTAASA